MKLLLMGFIIFGCASPNYKLTSITSKGIQERTGIEIGKDQKLGVISVPEGINLANPLTEDDAAKIALWNNTQLFADLSLLGIARSDITEASLLRNPRLDILFPVGHKPFELLLNLPFEAIWERPARMEAAEKAYEQLAYTLIQNGLNVIQDARIAHANLILAKKREIILSEAAALRKRISNISNDHRVRVGELTRVEGLATEIDFASSEELWMRAKHDTTLATMRFRMSLGLMMVGNDLKVSDVENVKTPVEGLAQLIDKALVMRPDLRAAEVAVMTAAKRAKWESKRLTQLSFLLSSKGVGDYGVLTGPGFSGEIPIFNQNNGRRERADAEVEQTSRQYLALKQRVVFEVSEARQLYIQAQEVLHRTKDQVLPLLDKSVRLAEREFKNGTAAYLFVLEQTRGFVDAQLRMAEFEAAVKRAEAILKRGVGAG